jgi:kynurenine formamidase
MIYDISPPITPRLQVWPGDTSPSREVLCDIARGDNITIYFTIKQAMLQ